MRPAVRDLPIDPQKYRKLLQQIFDEHPDVTISQLAGRLGKSADWLAKVMKDPEFLRPDFEFSVKCCVRGNPEYTEEEIRHMAREK